ncbi:hypothetical protein SAMN04489867_3674 [Pedococcus dokdonensis]|uniref:Uncharacterized protein n=1 Tax=Pedococcus dokdonensis TaxID=443156 RepID=A0A1H0V4W9_9MICO|nr:hypothetical protein [Pedococcus dokdonensis]SDP73470.1 hypothetical protein SAMN04489867_3674 [Pedococcus dokdonensis]
MSEQDRNLAEMDQDDVERHSVVQAVIQQVIDETSLSAEGRDPREVQAELTAALAQRGIGEQPPRWLETVAERLVNGHRYVEDPHRADPPA